MADTPRSPLVRLRQRLTGLTGAAKSETIRVVTARPREERPGSGPVKTKGCLSTILARSRRPHTYITSTSRINQADSATLTQLRDVADVNSLRPCRHFGTKCSSSGAFLTYVLMA